MRRALAAFLTLLLAAIVLFAACDPVRSARPASVAVDAGRSADAAGECRATCGPLQGTCITEGCSGTWTCVQCARAFLPAEREYCGCDGQTFRRQDLGCTDFAYAHEGPCP